MGGIDESREVRNLDRDQRNKQLLREEMNFRRLHLCSQEVEEFSALIGQKLGELKPCKKARSIMGFASIKNEVNLAIFLEQAAKQGKTILLPRVEKGNLAAVEFQGWQSTTRGAFGIREPVGSPYPPKDIDVVLVPGLVFDFQGHRLGYGKGFYDRFLAALPDTTFICGVAYEFQIVKDIRPHGQDVPVNWIVTEKSELAFNWDFF